MDDRATTEPSPAPPSVDERLALIYDGVSDPIYLHVVEGEAAFRFVSVNRAFLKATGLRLDEVVGRRMEDVLPATSHALVRGKYQQAIRERRRIEWTEVADYPAGRKVGEVTVAPIFDATGRCTHLLGSVHDITAHTEAEERLEELARAVTEKNRALNDAIRSAQEARDEAEQASRAKTTFLGLVSHELATPLQIMQLNLDALERARDAMGSAEAERVTRVRRASNRLREMLESLFEFVRLESGHLEVHRADVSLEELAGSTIEDLAPQAREKGLELRLVVDGVLPVARTDAKLLRLVLVNLVGNAIKYTDQGRVELALSFARNEHHLVVRDTGHGIPEEQRAAIFEPFTQLEALRQKHTPGVGLGLTLVRDLLKTLGGEIVVSSDVGRGSTFTVVLPWHP